MKDHNRYELCSAGDFGFIEAFSKAHNMLVHIPDNLKIKCCEPTEEKFKLKDQDYDSKTKFVKVLFKNCFEPLYIPQSWIMWRCIKCDKDYGNWEAFDYKEEHDNSGMCGKEE